MSNLPREKIINLIFENHLGELVCLDEFGMRFRKFRKLCQHVSLLANRKVSIYCKSEENKTSADLIAPGEGPEIKIIVDYKGNVSEAGDDLKCSRDNNSYFNGYVC